MSDPNIIETETRNPGLQLYDCDIRKSDQGYFIQPIGDTPRYEELLTDTGESQRRSGQVGEVILMMDNKRGDLVAVKHLTASTVFNDDTEKMQETMFEAHVLAHMQHPNIVSVIDVATDDPQNPNEIYIVMEYLEGESGDDWIARPHSLAEVKKFLNHVAAGAAHAHKNGYVIGDFRLGNIRFDSHGSPKIVDLGGAEKPGVNKFTYQVPKHHAPEQNPGIQNPTSETDIYLLGQMMFRLFSHTPGMDMQYMLEYFLNDSGSLMPMNVFYGQMFDTRREEYRQLSEIVKKSMATSKEDRYKDIGEMMTEVNALFDKLTS